MLAVVDRLGDADLDAADRVDHVPEALEVDDDEVVEAHAGELLELAHRARGAADRERLVPQHPGAARELAAVLVLAVGPVDDRVARDADAVRPLAVRRQVQQDRGVGPLAETGEVVDVVARALAGVRAHDQDVERLLGPLDDLLLGPVTADLELSAQVDRLEVAVEVAVEEHHGQAGDQGEHDHGGQHHLGDGVPLESLPAAFRRARSRLGSGLLSVGHSLTFGCSGPHGTRRRKTKPTRRFPILSPTCSFPQTGGGNPTLSGGMLAANPALPGCFSGRPLVKTRHAVATLQRMRHLRGPRPLLGAILTTLVLGGSLLAVPAGTAANAAPTPSSGTYRNPLEPTVPGDGTVDSCADPTVLKGQRPGDRFWYLYCTTDPAQRRGPRREGRAAVPPDPDHALARPGALDLPRRRPPRAPGVGGRRRRPLGPRRGLLPGHGPLLPDLRRHRHRRLAARAGRLRLDGDSAIGVAISDQPDRPLDGLRRAARGSPPGPDDRVQLLLDLRPRRPRRLRRREQRPVLRQLLRRHPRDRGRVRRAGRDARPGRPRR